MSAKPTREELVALLFSDPDTDEWQDDAEKLLEGERRVYAEEHASTEVLAHVIAELEMLLANLSAYEAGHERLNVIAVSAQRGAILLLVAAWAAERAANADPAGKFRCGVCQRLVPWSEGAADDMPEACATCWNLAHAEAAALGAEP